MVSRPTRNRSKSKPMEWLPMYPHKARFKSNPNPSQNHQTVPGTTKSTKPIWAARLLRLGLYFGGPWNQRRNKPLLSRAPFEAHPSPGFSNKCWLGSPNCGKVDHLQIDGRHPQSSIKIPGPRSSFRPLKEGIGISILAFQPTLQREASKNLSNAARDPCGQ